jgi:putative ABC transport system ATP-binding protein
MLVELNNLKPSYLSDKQVVGSEVYLQPKIHLDPGKKYLVTAASGKGKTSLLDLIFRVHQNYVGEIKYGEIHKKRIRQDQIAYVFQDLKLFDKLTALENVQLKNTMTQHRSEKEIQGLFERFDLLNQIDQKVKTLSLGQRQRTAIIRSLCMPYKLLLMDEPFSHLDQVNIRKICDFIETDLQEKGASLLITSLDGEGVFTYDRKFKV